jgi:ferredoxin-type protein NapG
MRCPPACPSGALEPLALEDVRMGRAQLDRSTCYTWQETLICRSCFERCPLKGRAIELERGMYPVITELCAGCGLCEHVCPKNSITTVPLRLL